MALSCLGLLRVTRRMCSEGNETMVLGTVGGGLVRSLGIDIMVSNNSFFFFFFVIIYKR